MKEKSCGPAEIHSSQLLQHQKCEFPHMAPSGHRGTMVLETSPGMKAVPLVQRGKEGAWLPQQDSCQSVTDMAEAVFVHLFLLSEAHNQEAKGRG